ncbi:MAG: DUF5686 family protein [Bacteroidota bacterium]
MLTAAKNNTSFVYVPAKYLLQVYGAVLLMLTLTPKLHAQGKPIHGSVTNQFTLEKIPFVSVVWKISGKGVLTDSLGNFRIDASNIKPDTLVVSYVGFQNLLVPVRAGKDSSALVLFLNQGKEADSVIVLHTYNRGLLWWKHIVKNKSINNPYKYNSYSYELYNKLEFDINNINRDGFNQYKLLRPFGFVLNNIDSVSENKPFLPVFMTESLSDFYCSNDPYRTKEHIKAMQTTGIKNETVFQFMAGINQRINSYENYMVLFGKEFVSPLSSQGENYYNYRGADTQYISGQRYFHLFFYPKREGENTFSGDCWINNKSWAVKKINLTISSSANINYINKLSIVQEFAQQNDSTWVFSKDKFVADISPMKKNKLSVIARKTCMYNNVLVNEPFIIKVLEKNKEKEQVTIGDSARLHNSAYWQSNRPEQLSANEQKVYKMIDTLVSIPLFKKYTNTAEFVVDGRKKLGKVEIGPWYKWISRNQLEKFRVRFDLATTEKFSKQLLLHGYLAYGFGDHALKGKGEVNYKFPDQRGLAFHVSYTEDLDNGRAHYNDEDITTDNMFSQSIRRPGIKQKFMLVNEIKFTVTKEWQNNFSVQPFLIRTSYETYAPLPHKDSLFASGKDVTSGEAGLKLRYAPGEKKIETHRKNIKLHGNNPVFEFRYAQGIKGLLNGQYNYEKLHGIISQKFRLHGWGSINYQAYGGKIFSQALPFMLLELHPGNEIYYYSKDGFNLMNRFEFYSDTYAGFNVEHDFEKKLINLVPFLRKTSIRQFWNVKAVWGNLSDGNRKLNHVDYGTYRLRTLKGHPYVEAGTGLDNIFRFFRVDLVWRFAPALTTPNGMPPPVYKNSNNTFGVFGSFRFQL